MQGTRSIRRNNLLEDFKFLIPHRKAVVIMTSLGNIGSSSSIGNHFQVKSGIAARPELTEEQRTQFETQRDQHLSDALAAGGVDESTAAAIKTELNAVIEASFTEGEGRPDPASIKEAVDGVFEKYGLEASEILRKPNGPPPGGRPAPGASNSQSAEADQYEDLLQMIQDLAENESDPAKLSQLIVDALYGLDKTA